ncbi:glycosyltransferase family 4 protein [Hymenobacter endophyticus]|uniref:Glycosyltransferase family 1 protein n=1 Tax=Hymenobacter endophyticus TaxID=3076335 RepID=A0ABU3TCR3_9BACT|nr:glycosyltransferase family 1 protein [Hymenobacter endophyticus]MDU0369158.1 glycosyltransferase family 1 protein [Hymenobacter endophyticus]
MRVLYDHQAFTLQDFGGVSRYHHELLCHATWESELAVALSNNLYLRDGHYSQHRTFLPNSRLPARWRVIEFCNNRASRRAIRRGEFDVLHPTLLDDNYFLDLLPAGKPLVVTIHDMIPALFPEHYPDRDARRLERTVQRADRIIAVSEHTRADILRLLPVAPEKVRVVYHGYTDREYPSAGPALPVPARYVLFTGSRALYKNFGCVVEALALLPATQAQGLHLVCAGGGPFTPTEHALLQRAGWADRAHQFGPVSDAQLNLLYRQAQAFIFPSEYEGFGLPILEAYGQQCPVLLSQASCFPEIAREAALYFPPNQPAALAEQLGRLLTDARLRRELVQLGQLRLLDFTWQHTARRTRTVYEEACQPLGAPGVRMPTGSPIPALEL